MLSAIAAFSLALLSAAALVPFVRRLATNLGAVDLPHDRHIHTRAVPRLGGIALALAFFLPLLLLFGLETGVARRFFAEPLHIVGLGVGGLIVCGLGVLDDVRGVRAWHKLWAQLAAAAVAYACGFRIERILLPLLGQLDMGVFSPIVTALWIVAIVNAINLIDGLDGLAAGVVFFACVTNFCVGALHGNPLVTLLSAALGGAVFGFLLFNFNPATIFMGDSGSMFLGYVLATTSILGASVKSSTTIAILVPLIALGLPIVDTLFAVVRRFLERRPLFSPDRGHLHHRLLAMGINHRRAVLSLYGLCVLFTTGAIAIAIGRNWQVGATLLVLSLALIGITRASGVFQLSLHRWRRKERVRSEIVQRLCQTVPMTLRRLDGCSDGALLRDALVDFATAAGLVAVDLRDSEEERLGSFAWHSTEGAPSGAERELVSASYPLDAAGSRARLSFSWLTDSGEIGAEADVLLQLVADACQSRLARTSARRGRLSASHLRPV